MSKQGEIEQLMDRVSGVMALINDRLGYTDDLEVENFINTGEIDPYYNIHPAINTVEKMNLLIQGSRAFMELYQTLGGELYMILDEEGENK